MNIEFASKLNHFGKTREPFFFVIDYAAKHFYASALASLEKGILYRIETQTNAMENVIKKPFSWQKNLPSKEHYLSQIASVIEEIKSGNTYMLNLTSPTKITLDCTLENLFYSANVINKLIFTRFYLCILKFLQRCLD